MAVLKVSSKTKPGKTAGAIMGCLKDDDQVEIHAIGPYAVNQAVKAIALASKFANGNGKQLTCSPGFIDANLDGRTMSAISFTVTAA